MKYSVATDFDGVLHSYVTPWISADQIPDPPVEGAIDWLNEIVAEFTGIIHTTRGNQPGGNEAVQEWLLKYGYEGPKLLIIDKKMPALIYVDDRGYRFMGPGTFPSAEMIHKMRPWYK